MAKIYLASSWRNAEQPGIVRTLRDFGHEVYDFRNPPNEITGFAWSELDSNWKNWTAAEYRENLKKPRAQEGFTNDFAGMTWADTGILLLPSGRSAHLELGWMCGQGKRTIVLTKDGEEPELMALIATHICISIDELLVLL